MEDNIEFLEVVELTEKIWEWLCDNPDKSKENYPYEDLSEYSAHCPLCEYAIKIRESMCFKECPLFNIKLCCGGVGDAYHLYKQFNRSGTGEDYEGRLAIYKALLNKRLKLM